MPIKAILFDFMGTCLDWHSSIVSALPSALSEAQRSSFALEWRQAYFAANAARAAQNKPPEDIDITHAQTLEVMLARREGFRMHFTNEVQNCCIEAWHHQKAWPEVNDAIEKLKRGGYEVFVHANGTTRLQLDLCRSSGLSFDMLFSSQLLGHIKPALQNYSKALELIKRQPEECALVAAHAYDTRGAKKAGWKTVYVHRWTDDVEEDQEVVKKENDAWIEDMKELDEVVASL